jgi:YD repeat-containing protein
MVGLPLKTAKTVQGKLVAGQVYKRDGNGNVVETSVFASASPQPLSAHDPASYYPPGYTSRQTISYTAKNKLREQTKAGDITTTYLWGYHSTYPLAVVKNATYAELVAVLGQPLIEELAGPSPGSDEQVRAKLAPLRTDARLRKAQVSTFTYQPLVGMTSQTDPSGRAMTYEYDALGRLLRVRDEQGRVLSEQEYHYARP